MASQTRCYAYESVVVGDRANAQFGDQYGDQYINVNHFHQQAPGECAQRSQKATS